VFYRFACHAVTRCTVTYLCPATKALLCIPTREQKLDVAHNSMTVATIIPALQATTGLRHLRLHLQFASSWLFWRYPRPWCEYNSPTRNYYYCCCHLQARVFCVLCLQETSGASETWRKETYSHRIWHYGRKHWALTVETFSNGHQSQCQVPKQKRN
jgi:hypothetical protein